MLFITPEQRGKGLGKEVDSFLCIYQIAKILGFSG